MKLLQKFDTQDEAKLWLANEGFTQWADDSGLNLFHNQTNFAFVRLRFAGLEWLIEEPTKGTQ